LNASGNLDFQLGRWQDAIRAARAAIDLDPLDSGHRYLLAGSLSANGQHRDSEQVLREMLDLKTIDAEGIHSSIAQELLFQHRPDAALAEVNLEPIEEDRQYGLIDAYYSLGRRQDSDRLLASFEAKYGADASQVSSIAEIHAFRGETDLAFRWINLALTARDPSLFLIKGNIGRYPNINRDARYRTILHKLRLPE
jgi:tetratricopeptide (TPR) repeat protein